jgi:hypothetical protein
MEEHPSRLKSKIIYACLILVIWVLMLFFPIWKFEYIPYSLLNDKEYSVLHDFIFMQRYSFHLNLIALSGPVFILSAVINPKKLITGWFGIFLLVILIGGLAFYYSERIELMWGWYFYVIGIVSVHSFVVPKLFPGIYDRKTPEISAIKTKNVPYENHQNDSILEEFEPTTAFEFYNDINEKLMELIIVEEKDPRDIKNEYLLNRLRSYPQFLELNIEKSTAEEKEKFIKNLAEKILSEQYTALIEMNSRRNNSAQTYSSGFSNSNKSKIYRGKSTSSIHQIATFSDGKIYKGKTTSSIHQVGSINGNKIYSGKSQSSIHQVGTIKEGKIYQGKTTSSIHQIATINEGKIYQGKTTSSIHQIATVDGGDASAAAAAAFILLL